MSIAPTFGLVPEQKQKRTYSADYTASDAFLRSFAWRKLRMRALVNAKGACMACGAKAGDGTVLHVDHIKPRRLHPKLALDLGNLQVLCAACNHGKGNWDETDWRSA